MFSAFKRALPQISIFHRPNVPASEKALDLLRSAIIAPYPPDKPHAPPLEFNLDVVDSLPTIDQIRTTESYLTRGGGLKSFLSIDPASPDANEQPGSPEKVLILAGRNPGAFRWPVVVDWTGGRASVGDVEGVKDILEHLRKKRDGELVDDDDDERKPKGWFS